MKVKNNVDKKISNFIRKYIIVYLTRNLGNVVEDEEKITCYVKKNRCKKKRYEYTIACFGINEEDKKIAEKYNLNKPICYVIDGLEFKKDEVNIWGYNNCEVIIKNCDFDFGLNVHIDGKCTLENTCIREFDLLIGANELIIKNMDIRNNFILAGMKLHVGLWAEDKLEISNSYIGRTREKTKVNIISPKGINIYNSKIAGDIVKCSSDKIIVDKKSLIEATEKVDLEVKEFYEININSPIINYNENTINNDKKTVILKRITEPLTIKRIEFIRLLKEIRDNCEKINNERTDEYRKNLNKNKISKVLKK